MTISLFNSQDKKMTDEFFSSGAPTQTLLSRKNQMGALTLGEGALPSASVLEGLPIRTSDDVRLCPQFHPIKIITLQLYTLPLVSIGCGKVLSNPLDGRKRASYAKECYRLDLSSLFSISHCEERLVRRGNLILYFHSSYTSSLFPTFNTNIRR